MNDTTYGDDLYFLIGEFMNLIQACRDKGVEFGGTDGFTLDEMADTVNSYLTQLGFDNDNIARLWSGEEQLTSS